MDELIRKVYINDLSLQNVKDLTRDKVPVILYDNLNINDDILSIIGDRSFLLFPVSANSPSGHWIAIIYRKETHTIEYWDPYGFTIDQELRFSTNPSVERNVLGKLFLKAQQQYSVKIEYNTFKYQKLITGNNKKERSPIILNMSSFMFKLSYNITGTFSLVKSLTFCSDKSFI